MTEHYQILRTGLLSLLEQLRGRLMEEDAAEAFNFIEHNEFGISFELICAQLHEKEVEISSDIYDEIEAIGKLMSIDRTVWQTLKTDT